MIKKIVMACLIITFGGSLHAETTSFIGLEIGNSNVQGDRIDQPDYKDDDLSYGFRIGAQDENWRTTLIYNVYDNSNSDQNVEQVLLALDYYIPINNLVIKPYIGANLGYGNYESSFVDESGFLYGGQAGLTFNIIEALNFDLSYRYSLSNIDALDHAGSIMVSVDYLF